MSKDNEEKQNIPTDLSKKIAEKKAETEKVKEEKVTLDENTVKVKIYSPFRVYFDGIATSVSAENDTGPFDILPKHHNFMTLLNEGELVVRMEMGVQRYKITRGIMHVKENAIIVFLDV